MKNTFLITLIISCAYPFIGFSQDSTYIDDLAKETSIQHATYIRYKTKTDSGWKVTDYWLNHKVQMTGLFVDDSCHTKQGEFNTYDTSGNHITRIMYYRGKTEGKETYYYDNKQIRVEGNNKAGEHDGEWIGYFKDGKLSGKAVYEKGKQVSATFFDENGNQDHSKTVFQREAVYPSGTASLYQFLGQKLKYPNKAVRNNIQGRVVVQFKVTEEGKLTDIRLNTSVEKTLDAEALRVVRMIPDWEPAIIGGIPTYSYFKLPIDFKF